MAQATGEQPSGDKRWQRQGRPYGRLSRTRAFRETHYKGILKALEKAGRLKVIKAGPNRRAGTFGDAAMMVRFA